MWRVFFFFFFYCILDIIPLLDMELIKIYVRGHNLFDIFYGRCRSELTDVLKRYIDAAPRENFKDILDAIDSFVYFENRRKL